MNPQAQKITESIINFLKSSNKLDLLPEVVELLKKEVQKISGQNTAIITSAKPLTEEELLEIKKQLFSLFGRQLEVINKIDSKVIGGFVIQVSDSVLDLSVNSYLNSLEEKISHENN